MKNNNNNKNIMTNVKTMAIEGMRIIREMANSNFDLYEKASLFANIHFLDATISEVTKRLTEAEIIYYAMQNTYNINIYNVSDNIMYVYNRMSKKVEAYRLILNYLTLVRSESNLGYLFALQNQLTKYRSNI